jgi:hypothetical protein
MKQLNISGKTRSVAIATIPQVCVLFDIRSDAVTRRSKKKERCRWRQRSYGRVCKELDKVTTYFKFLQSLLCAFQFLLGILHGLLSFRRHFEKGTAPVQQLKSVT